MKRFLLVLVVVVVVAACGPPAQQPDAAPPEIDAAVDAAPPEIDAGVDAPVDAAAGPSRLELTGGARMTGGSLVVDVQLTPIKP